VFCLLGGRDEDKRSVLQEFAALVCVADGGHHHLRGCGRSVGVVLMGKTLSLHCSYHINVRCRANATHQLISASGRRVKGAIYCEKHAKEVIARYRKKMGWYWEAVLLEEGDGDG